MKKCPFCAEDIQDAAIVCKHCGRDLAVPLTSAPIAPPTIASMTPTTQPAGSLRNGWGCLGTLFIVCCVLGGLFFTIIGIGAVMRLGSTTLDQKAPAPTAEKPRFFLRPELQGLRLTNDGSETWKHCDVTIDHRFSATAFNLSPGIAKVIPYRDFGGLNPDEGFTRANGARIHLACLDGLERTGEAD